MTHEHVGDDVKTVKSPFGDVPARHSQPSLSKPVPHAGQSGRGAYDGDDARRGESGLKSDSDPAPTPRN